MALALNLITFELLGDFPFVGNAEEAHASALTLQPFVRELIQGPTPLYLLEKPTAGTGASLLVSATTMIATGRHPTMLTEGKDEDEWRKRITATLGTVPKSL